VRGLDRFNQVVVQVEAVEIFDTMNSNNHIVKVPVLGHVGVSLGFE